MGSIKAKRVVAEITHMTRRSPSVGMAPRSSFGSLCMPHVLKANPTNPTSIKTRLAAHPQRDARTRWRHFGGKWTASTGMLAVLAAAAFAPIGLVSMLDVGGEGGGDG